MRLMIRSITAAAALCSFAVPALHAQAVARPNFSGTWVLDAAKSQSSGSLPSAATWTIAQHGDTLITDRESTVEGAGAVKAHMVVGFDGKSWKNSISQPGIGDIEVGMTASWDKATVVVTMTGTMQETEFVQTGRWTLSADGKSLEVHTSVTVGGEEVQSATTVWAKKN